MADTRVEAPAELPPETGAKPAKERGYFGAFFAQARGFWSGPTRRTAWLLTAGVLVFVLLNLATNIGINRWNKFFFDALERKDLGAVTLGVGIILGLAVTSAAIAVGLVHMRMRLQLRWREWLTGSLIRQWLSERRFYQLNIVGGEAANPEFRIADDARLAIEPLVDFVIGLANALLAAIAFIGILWAVGGSLTVGGVTIPGYMVFAAVIYTALTSTAVVLIGRPLVAAVEAKNGGEAQLRYELTRVKDSAENIALIGGDDDERARLGQTFGELARRWLRVIWKQAHMTWVSNGNAVLAPVIPLLLGAPKYLSGEMSLGTLMQAATAFTQVQIALNWLVDNSIRLAEWFASAQRVVELTDALDDLERTIGESGSTETVTLAHSHDQAVHLCDVSIRQHNGRLMLDGADVSIAPGEKVLVKGESGSGKSTLIRAMAGLWPWGSGKILRPEKARVAFLPQRPYIPLGTLRTALLYPDTDRAIDDERLKAVLKKVGLSHLGPRLDEEDQWTSILSGGEQQRLAFARLLVDPPDIVIMDEATSALDEDSQARMMEFLRTDLASATVLHVGHRPGLEEHHDREIKLVREGGGAAVARHRRYPRLKLFNRFVKPPAAARDGHA
jgi:vitamin B12/bleomycin/antimicrobial peptide transport system ATP-binding/permease protein